MKKNEKISEREAHVAFNMIPGIGATTLEKLAAAAGGSAAAAYEAFPDKRDWRGEEPDFRGEFARAAKQNVRIVTLADPDYPAQLRAIASPPLALYVTGSVEALSLPGVALVGTRHATAYGSDVAGRFAIGLAHAGWSVVSGLARGVDAAAHAGALAARGVTVGVLGGALDEFFPPENRALARRIVASGGAVVSEFPFGRSPDRTTFPQRNRVVAGLASGTVAIEAPPKSGTLITCSLALEQGRAVMAVPGRIDALSSRGCLQLIRDGARMVTCVEDVLEELTSLEGIALAARGRPEMAPAVAGVPSAPERTALARRAARSPEAGLSLDEAAVLRAIPEGGAVADELVRATGMPVAKVNALLVSLRIKRKIRLHPGNRVTFAENGRT